MKTKTSCTIKKLLVDNLRSYDSKKACKQSKLEYKSRLHCTDITVYYYYYSDDQKTLEFEDDFLSILNPISAGVLENQDMLGGSI